MAVNYKHMHILERDSSVNRMSDRDAQQQAVKSFWKWKFADCKP